MASQSCRLYAFLVLLLAFQSACRVKGNTVVTPPQCRPVAATSSNLLQFIINLLILEGELYLRASNGTGLDVIAPDLVQGPLPIGARRANLDSVTRGIVQEFGLQSVGQIRAIIQTGLVPRIERPLLNLSVATFDIFVRSALNVTSLSPPFDPYANTVNFLLTASTVSSLSKQYSVSIGSRIVLPVLRRVADGIASTLAARLGVFRALLNLRANATVSPYQFTVANLTASIAQLVNRLGQCGVKDEGLIVPVQLGAENRTTSNVVPADPNSLGYPRTTLEVLRILFGTGNATRPGGLLPAGANGTLYRRIVLLRRS